MAITDVLDELRIPYRRAGESHHVTQGWVGIDCPDCSPGSGKYKLGISLRGGYATCWSCGYSPIVTTLASISGKPWKVVALLLASTGVYDPDPGRRGKQGQFSWPSGVGPLLPPHKSYLRERGFNPDELAQRWGLCGTGPTPRLPWRIVIPIHRDGEPVSWTTRVINEIWDVKYANARPEEEAIPAKELLYGEDHCRHAVVVCEGPTDVWRVGPGAVATLGVNVTTAQKGRLARFPIRAVCFDNEPLAQMRAHRLAADLAPFPGSTHVVELDAPDPGSASPREVVRLREAFLE